MGGAVAIKGSSKAKDEQEEKFKALATLSKTLPLYDEADYTIASKILPSGSLSLNLAIGGGYPSGCIVDIFGAESAGKSLLSILAIAEVQKAGGVAVVWDAERSYSKNLEWMRINGVDTSKLKFLRLRPTEGCEIGFDAVEQICKANAADLIVVDSIPSLIPQDAIDKGMTENEMLGRRAAIVTRFCGRIVGVLDESKTTIMFINQIRANIVSGPAAFAAPKTKETSNYSLRHFSSLRLQVRKMSKSKMVNGVPFSHRVQVVAVKNKVAAPYRTAEFDIAYTKGVDTAAEVADILISAGEAEKAGAWIKYENEKYNGRDAFVEALRDVKLYDKAFKKAVSLSGKVNLFGVESPAEAEAGTLSVSEEDAE